MDSTLFSQPTVQDEEPCLTSVYYSTKPSDFENSISIDVLITSMQGLNDVLKAIGSTSNIKLTVRVKATKEGSYEWIFEIWPIIEGFGKDYGWIGLFLSYFNITHRTTKNAIVKSVLKITELMVKFIKLTGESIDDFVRMVREDKEVSDGAKDFLIRLRNNAYLCDGMEAFTKPLEDQNILLLELRESNELKIEIKKEERKSFKIATLEKETIVKNTMKVKIKYLSPSTTRWGFETDTGDFWAEVEDEEFLRQVRFSDVTTIAKIEYEANVTTRKVLKKNAHRESKIHSVTRIHPIRDLFNYKNLTQEESSE